MAEINSPTSMGVTMCQSLGSPSQTRVGMPKGYSFCKQCTLLVLIDSVRFIVNHLLGVLLLTKKFTTLPTNIIEYQI